MSKAELQFKHAGRSAIIIVVVTAMLLGFGWLIGGDAVELWGMPATFACALLALGINWIAFIPSAIARSDTYYDTIGTLTYLSVMAAAWFAVGSPDLRATVIAALVMIWALRLGIFLNRRIHASGGSDERFTKIKINPPRFLVAWTLQALWVTLTGAAALAAITASNTVAIGLFFWIGLAMWIGGFVIEAVADDQKRRFKADPANKGKFIQSGLWAWSQHPNYFGEITLWTGILVMAIPVLSGWSWAVVISPIFVYLLLTRVSGVNLLDGIGKKRWGDDPAYQAYRNNTPVLIPRPPKG